MEHFIIEGGQKFGGEVNICGAKNAALPIIFAAILGTKPITLTNVPNLTDIKFTLEVLRNCGASATQEGDRLEVNPEPINNFVVPYELAKKMRASIWALGPLVGRFGYGEVALPGGCAIGSRPVDLHIEALKKLGAEIEIKEGMLIARAPQGLTGGHVFFDKISVGATITAVCAAVLAKGESRIDNCAQEPEVVDVCNFLVSLGAKITGIGTRNLTVTGVPILGGTQDYRVIPDRIECGTYLIASALSRSKVTCHNVCVEHMEATLEKLHEAGAKITIDGNSVTADFTGVIPKGVNIVTAPYPGLATDMQAQFTLLNCLAEGTSFITETIFENRFMHVPELMRMGANIVQKGNTIYITGVKELSGAQVKATDLRASISLVLAGCVAKGQTMVEEIYHIDRGYETVEKQIAKIGATITRCKSEVY